MADFKLLPSISNNIKKTEMKSIYFMHIPKCGGTTIDNIFLKLSLVLGTFKFKRFKYPNLQYNEKFFLEKLDSIEPVFISGHLDYNFTKNIENIFTCSILRNPIDRIISHYKFQILKSNKNPSQFSFDEFLEQEVSLNRDNFMTRHFSGHIGLKKMITEHETNKAMENLKKFDKINVFENWDYFVSNLLSTFGLPSVFYSKFQEHHYSFVFKPKEAHIDLIRKHYEHDFLLYDYAYKIATVDEKFKKLDYNKNICIVSPIVEAENRLYTPEQVKNFFQNKKQSIL